KLVAHNCDPHARNAGLVFFNLQGKALSVCSMNSFPDSVTGFLPQGGIQFFAGAALSSQNSPTQRRSCLRVDNTDVRNHPNGMVGLDFFDVAHTFALRNTDVAKLV